MAGDKLYEAETWVEVQRLRGLLAEARGVLRGVAMSAPRIDDIEWRPVLVAEAKRLLARLEAEIPEEPETCRQPRSYPL